MESLLNPYLRVTTLRVCVCVGTRVQTCSRQVSPVCKSVSLLAWRWQLLYSYILLLFLETPEDKPVELWLVPNFILSHCFYFLGHSNLEEQHFYLKQLENTIVSICSVVQEPTNWPRACLGAALNVEIPYLVFLCVQSREQGSFLLFGNPVSC